MIVRSIAALCLASLVAACQPMATREAPPSGPGPEAILGELEAVIPGLYLQALRAEDRQAPLFMDISSSRLAAAELALDLRQHQAEGAQRRFRLVLGAGEGGDRLAGRFMPIDQDGNPAGRECRMRFRLSSQGLSGETDPGECRFESGSQRLGLLKEMNFDGASVSIADQVFDDLGQPVAAPQVLQFHRSSRFVGTAAVREAGTLDWRVAASLQLSTNQALIEPLDASGMTLGILIDLQLLDRPDLDEPILSLQVSTVDGADRLGQTWVEAGAQRIGLGLPDVRVELQRVPVAGNNAR